MAAGEQDLATGKADVRELIARGDARKTRNADGVRGMYIGFGNLAGSDKRNSESCLAERDDVMIRAEVPSEIVSGPAKLGDGFLLSTRKGEEPGEVPSRVADDQHVPEVLGRQFVDVLRSAGELDGFLCAAFVGEDDGGFLDAGENRVIHFTAGR